MILILKKKRVIVTRYANLKSPIKDTQLVVLFYAKLLPSPVRYGPFAFLFDLSMASFLQNCQDHGCLTFLDNVHGVQIVLIQTSSSWMSRWK